MGGWLARGYWRAVDDVGKMSQCHTREPAIVRAPIAGEVLEGWASSSNGCGPAVRRVYAPAAAKVLEVGASSSVGHNLSDPDGGPPATRGTKLRTKPRLTRCTRLELPTSYLHNGRVPKRTPRQPLESVDQRRVWGGARIWSKQQQRRKEEEIKKRFGKPEPPPSLHRPKRPHFRLIAAALAAALAAPPSSTATFFFFFSLSFFSFLAFSALFIRSYNDGIVIRGRGTGRGRLPPGGDVLGWAAGGIRWPRCADEHDASVCRRQPQGRTGTGRLSHKEKQRGERDSWFL